MLQYFTLREGLGRREGVNNENAQMDGFLELDDIIGLGGE